MKRLIATFFALLLASQASAFDLEASLRSIAIGEPGTPAAELVTVQSGGKSLSEAVESVRRRGNVERIVSAETRTEGDREVHHIRYMTKDGKVKTAKVQGRRLR